VQDGTTYYYVVSAVFPAGEGPNSAEVSATPTEFGPPAPENVQATPGNTEVYLEWTTSDGAAYYNIYRSVSSPANFTKVATVLGTSYWDTGLQNGTTYYYTVTAVSACDEEGFGSYPYASATPQDFQPPTFSSASPGISGFNIWWNQEVYDGEVSGSYGSPTFSFEVSGAPNTIWYVYSLPLGGYCDQAGWHYDYPPQLIGIIKLGSDGTGTFSDPKAGWYFSDEQFYQLVSGNEASQIFGYSVHYIEYDDYEYMGLPGGAVQNDLIPPSPDVNSVLSGGRLHSVFWHGSDGSRYTDLGPFFFDDSTDPYDHEWVESSQSWDLYGYSVNFGYGDTLWFYGFSGYDSGSNFDPPYYPCDMVSLIGVLSQ
jgi:hypothetical protein